MRFDLPGVSISFSDLRREDADRVRSDFDPYEPSQSQEGPADVVVETDPGPAPNFVDVQNPAADGRVTASDGHRLHILAGGRVCALPRFDAGPPFDLRCQQGFPLRTLMRSILRPLLQVALPHRGGIAVHGTAVDIEGRGIIVAGWSESGKTETGLAFLEHGASFVSDKWTIVTTEHTLAPFPISVGIRRWALTYLPRLRRSLPRPARIQLGLAAVASAGTRPIRRVGRSGRLSNLTADNLERAVALIERAALTPSEVSRIYGADRPLAKTPLRAVVLLTTVPGDAVSVRRARAAWAARRFARSASYERKGFFELHRRMRYSFPEMSEDFESAVESREEDRLTQLLEDVPILEVTAPFPTDPRCVAEAIASHL
jgi:hypothetical protein